MRLKFRCHTLDVSMAFGLLLFDAEGQQRASADSLTPTPLSAPSSAALPAHPGPAQSFSDSLSYRAAAPGFFGFPNIFKKNLGPSEPSPSPSVKTVSPQTAKALPQQHPEAVPEEKLLVADCGKTKPFDPGMNLLKKIHSSLFQGLSQLQPCRKSSPMIPQCFLGQSSDPRATPPLACDDASPLNTQNQAKGSIIFKRGLRLSDSLTKIIAGRALEPLAARILQEIDHHYLEHPPCSKPSLLRSLARVEQFIGRNRRELIERCEQRGACYLHAGAQMVQQTRSWLPLPLQIDRDSQQIIVHLKSLVLNQQVGAQHGHLGYFSQGSYKKAALAYDFDTRAMMVRLKFKVVDDKLLQELPKIQQELKIERKFNPLKTYHLTLYSSKHRTNIAARKARMSFFHTPEDSSNDSNNGGGMPRLKNRLVLSTLLQPMTLQLLSQQLHDQQKTLSHDQTLRIIAQLLTQLNHLHALNIIHRDIKPQNILLSSEFTPTLTDFGLAIPARGLQRRSTVNEKLAYLAKCGGVTAGTPGFMSPEYLEALLEASDLGNAPLCLLKANSDPKIDIFAMGLTLLTLFRHTQIAFTVPRKDPDFLSHNLAIARNYQTELQNKRWSDSQDACIDRLLLRMIDPLPGFRPTAQEALFEFEELVR